MDILKEIYPTDRFLDGDFNCNVPKFDVQVEEAGDKR